MNQHFDTSINMEEIDPSDIFIVVAGVTGAGKSTFISRCTGEPPSNVGHGLESFTIHTRIHSMQRNGRTVHLIDTPGFADSYRSEDEVFKEIAYMLIKAYQLGIRLSGILYMHPLTGNRMLGSLVRPLALLKALCGVEAYQAVMLAATRGEAVSLQQRRDRLEQLKANPQFWHDFCATGSMIVEPMDTSADALSVIDMIIARNSTYVLRFQQQAVLEDLPIEKTDAGKVVLAPMSEEYRRLWGENANLQKELERMKTDKQDPEDAEHHREIKTSLEMWQERMDAMKTTTNELLSEGDRRALEEQIRLKVRIEQLEAQVREPGQNTELQRQNEALLAERANIQSMVQFKSMKYAKVGAGAGIMGAVAGIGQLAATTGCNVM